MTKRRLTSNEALTHAWAHDTVPQSDFHSNATAYASNTSYYKKDKLLTYFSYTTPVAQRITKLDGSVFFLISSTKFSPTTAKHISELRAACNNMKVYALPFSEGWAFSSRDGGIATAPVMGFVRRTVLNDVESLMRKAASARTNAPRYIAEAGRMVMEFNACLADLTQYDPVYADTDTINMSEAVDIDLEQLRELVKAERERTTEKKRLQQQEKLTEHLAYVDSWRLHLPAGKYPASRDTSRAEKELRLSKDGRHVETIGSATIPVGYARRLWPVVQMARAAGDAKQATPSLVANAVGMRLGVFTLNHINNRGDIIAGCTTVKYEEMLYISTLLDWTIPEENTHE